MNNAEQASLQARTQSSEATGIEIVDVTASRSPTCRGRHRTSS
jgi:hypothetical protein